MKKCQNSVIIFHNDITNAWLDPWMLGCENSAIHGQEVQGAVLLTVGQSYVGNDVTHSTLLDRVRACSYEKLPK